MCSNPCSDTSHGGGFGFYSPLRGACPDCPGGSPIKVEDRAGRGRTEKLIATLFLPLKSPPPSHPPSRGGKVATRSTLQLVCDSSPP